MDFIKLISSCKTYIKGLSNSEVSLKSISFSIVEDKGEFIIYFTWKQNEYNKFYIERDNFRKLIKSYMSNKEFSFDIKRSTATKYIFVKRDYKKNAEESNKV